MSQTIVGYAIPGTEAAPLVIRGDLSGAASGVAARTRFPPLASPSRGPSLVPVEMPWIVVIGDPMGIDTIGVNEILGRESSVAVSRPRQAEDLPDSELGYRGVDLMVITGSGRELLASLDRSRQMALTDYLRGGGRVLLTLGSSLSSVRRDVPWLLATLPFEASDLSTSTIDPAALESFTATQIRLPSFEGARLPKRIGRVLLSGRTAQRLSTPLAVEYGIGLGRLTVIAADLDRGAFVRWPERLDLIRRLVGDVIDPKRSAEPAAGSRATAFDDLAGQMRATLDQFAIKRSVGFSVVALILMTLLALIGPLDYWLLNRVVGRPRFGWITFPATAIALSALLIHYSSASSRGPEATGEAEAASSPPRGVGARNQVEFIDIDTVSRIGRAWTWSVLYSHEAGRFDVSFRPRSESKAWVPDLQSLMTAPFGYPSSAFGGIQIAGEDARMPAFEVAIGRDGGNRQGADFHSSVRQLPLAPRSSKSLATDARFRIEPGPVSGLRQRPGSELIEGELVNPLPVDLMEGRLIYQNWVYLLPTRFPRGGTIPSVDGLRQKNFRWLLTRKKALESSSESEVWDPTDWDSPNRIAEMLMFYRAAGGRRYTGLGNRPLKRLDLSASLTDDRCLLVARLEEPLTEQLIEPERDGLRFASDRTLTMVRVLLPVQITQRY
jgi:hypothetical protein